MSSLNYVCKTYDGSCFLWVDDPIPSTWEHDVNLVDTSILYIYIYNTRFRVFVLALKQSKFAIQDLGMDVEKLSPK